MPEGEHTVPTYLSRSSQTWLKGLRETYDWTPTQWRTAVLTAEAQDRHGKARRQLAREGLTVPTADGGLKAHPCANIVRDEAALISRLMRWLDLSPATKPHKRSLPTPTPTSDLVSRLRTRRGLA